MARVNAVGVSVLRKTDEIARKEGTEFLLDSFGVLERELDFDLQGQALDMAAKYILRWCTRCGIKNLLCS